jgi:hypothetical protein
MPQARDHELHAVARVLAILRPMPDHQRRRVLAYVVDRAALMPPPRPDRPEGNGHDRIAPDLPFDRAPVS